jgi:anti-sigma B factor antagonist
MEFTTRAVHSGWTVFEVKGRVDGHSAPEFETQVMAGLTPEIKLSIDLSGLDYISSAGLRVLLGVHKRIASLGGRVVLMEPKSAVRDVLEISGFSSIFPIVSGLDELR